ncbi:homoserine dehydrogenase [Agrococcus sediminis]|uniref:Homoserine dehydrogenase n=1 Tax=Agrococcus sediminis TaxID=2599924 RepID=A0A5M8QAQ8_9MICO|nr:MULTISPECIES: homoserine dehydrogenase [Agrococcus]KAA6432121.1 homoserine dehydrogenase [Agrococcus sediminis]MDR7232989.1 homoserine dehydrogenase [Agrococcus sp. BE272]RWR25063.1 homoserine dehydrogenase [Agrococcus lahaulensis]
MNSYRSLRIALLGAGSVGAQVARILLEHGDELAARVGAPLELVGIGVRDVDAKRDVELPRELLTTDLATLVAGADVVVELLGGIEPARTLLLDALAAGADVVTANKALVAAHGPELFQAAETVGAQVAYEAAVGGAIPIIRPLEQSLAGDRVLRVMGIVNGTTNFILDRMHTEGSTLEDALATATALGYAEADPTADIEGYDAASKATILASLAFHTEVPAACVHREGITGVTDAMVQQAERTGRVLKLVAICERLEGDAGDRVSARVHPVSLPSTHPLAAVHEAKNAIFVTAEAAGDLMFYGAGAGGPETASAVLGDLVSIARRHVLGGPGGPASTHADLAIAPFDEVLARHELGLTVADRPGVLAAVAGLFAEHDVSVESVRQDPGDGSASLVLGTHTATEGRIAAVLEALAAHTDVERIDSVIRLID